MNQRNDTIKQQYFIVALLMFFVSLIVVSILLAPMISFTEIAVNATSESPYASTMAMVLRYIPVMVVIVLMISLFAIISNK